MRCLRILAIFVATEAHAENVTLQAVLEAADRAPASRATDLDVRAAEARHDAAGAWAPTAVRVGTNRLTARLVTGIAIPLPLLGTIGAARAEAAAQATTVRDEASVERRALRRRAIGAWLELARADTQTRTLAAAAAQAAELERVARGRFDAGAAGEVDVTSARAARARADVAVVAAQREASARAAELAGVLGWDATVERHFSGALPGGDANLDRLRGRLANHPQRAAALSQIAQRDATARRIDVARRPSLSLELSAAYGDPTLTDTNNHRLGTDVFAGLSIELPLFGHLDDQRRAVQGEIGAAQLRLEALDAELTASLVAAYRRWQATAERVSSLERDVLPAQQQATQLAQQAYREGARELVTALQAARELQDVGAELANARIDAALAWEELQTAAGVDDAR